MSRSICSFVTLLSLSFPCMSVQAQQSDFRIEGVLCDSVSRQPQPFGTLRLLPMGQHAKPLKVVTSREDGRFSLSVDRAGRYTLEAVVTGMQPLRREVSLTAGSRTVNLDTLYIKEYTSTLGAAMVTAQKPLVRAELDKISYSMADDPDAQTNTTLEMLRKVPMVTVDGEDNIKVNGSSSFKVYVNGKPNKMMSSSPSEIFKSYPASAIKKIEVITNPGAKYDAEGATGVLNIITESKVNTSGYSLTPSLRVDNRGVSGGVFGMTQFGKLVLSAYYHAGKSWNGHSRSENDREVFADPVNHLFSSVSESKGENLFQVGNLDGSYEFSDKDLLSVSVGMYAFKNENKGWADYRMDDEAGNPVYSYSQRQRNKGKSLYLNASADFQHTFAENQYLTFSYRYGLSPTKNRNHNEYEKLHQIPASLRLEDLYTDPDNLSYEHTAQVDFTTPLGKEKEHTLSAGLKYINRLNRSNNLEWSRPAGSDAGFTLNDAQSIRYRHRGDIGAAYAEYEFSKKDWSLMAGSRYEYYHYRATYPDGKRSGFSSHIGNWVPSVSLGYNFTPTMMLKGGYNMRILRPSIDMLSPYQDFSTPGIVAYGNPSLGSSKWHNLELSYSMFGAKINLMTSLSYNFSNDEMESYEFYRDGLVHQTYGNFLHSKTTTLSASVNWTYAEGSSLFINASGSYSDYKSVRMNQKNSGFSANCFGGVRQKLPWKFQVGLWAGGGSKDINLQGKGSGYHFYSLSLTRKFLKDDRLSLSLSASNFLTRYRYYKDETLTDQFRSRYKSRHDSYRVSLGVSYRLGSLKASVKKADRSISNDDVQSSGNSGGQGGQGE